MSTDGCITFNEAKKDLLTKGKGVAIAEFCKKHDESIHYGESCTDGGNCEIDYLLLL